MRNTVAGAPFYCQKALLLQPWRPSWRETLIVKDRPGDANLDSYGAKNFCPCTQL